MTCQHCGAELPPIAMFCGECGRSVSARPVQPRIENRPEPSGGARGDDAPVVAAPVVPTPAPEIAPELEPELGPEPDPEPEPEPQPEPEPESEPETERETACAECGTSALPDDRYCAECGHVLANNIRRVEPLTEGAVRPEPITPEPTIPEPTTSEPTAPVLVEQAMQPRAAVDRSRTPIVAPASAAERFVLQFSTGESYTVLGSGLVGRNPRPEPGEVVDHVVTIVDPGRSVSKTHLEFGQADGVLWVSDRHSGNGTVIRESGAEPQLCVPGRRYPVDRGTRIDLGEQFVVVS